MLCLLLYKIRLIEGHKTGIINKAPILKSKTK